MITPPRARSTADRWQDRLDQLIVATAVTAIVGVALQTLAKHGPLHILGLIAAIAAWLVFATDASVMLTVSPEPGRWARGHVFELVLLVVTCPLWPVLFYRLLVLELLPALTVLEVAKLAKLVKVAYALRRGRGNPGRGWIEVVVVLLAAMAVGLLVILH
jgi:hypothetical protein